MLELAGALDVDRLDAAARLGPSQGVRNRWQVEDEVGDRPTDSDQVRVLVRREFGHAFDRPGEPPLRLSVVRVAADRHLLVLVAHRRVWHDELWDGYLGALTQAYRRTAGEGGPCPPVPADSLPGLLDVAGPTQPWGAQPGVAQSSAESSGPLQALEFPGESSGLRPARTDTATIEAPLTVGRTAQLDQVGRRVGVAAQALLLAAFQIVMTRACGVEDLLVAVPVSSHRLPGAAPDRARPATALVRAHVAGAEPLVGLLRRTQRELAAGTGAVDLDDPCAPVPDPAPARLRFGEFRPPTVLFEPPGVRASLLRFGTGHAREAVNLTYEQRGEGPRRQLVLRLEYRADVIGAVLARSLLDQTTCALAGFTTDALERPTDDLPVLSDPARRRMLDRSAGAAVEAPATTLPDLVDRQIRCRPTACAVVTEHAAVSYRELDAAADLAADRLAAHGVTDGSVVACLLDPGLELVVTALAVVRLGAVYLPLDPALPDERVLTVLADAASAAVIGARADQLPGLPCVVLPCLVLPTPGEQPPRRPDPGRRPDPEQPAYVVYPPEPSGPPRGVLVGHRAVGDYLRWLLRTSGLGATDSVLLAASPGFDASIAEMFGALACGARLVVARPGGLRDTGYLSRLLREQDITSMHLVPAQLAALLAGPTMERSSSLRWVPVGGEPLPGALADRFTASFDARLSYFHGSTEATVAVSRYEIAHAQGRRTVPLGTPKDNTQVYVLDDRLRPVDVGVVGRIHVGGQQLALGYLGRPGATAVQFVADPFTAGGRLLRTGDLGRWTREGVLELVGPAHGAVRPGGRRIAFTEIESVVAAAADVPQCVVTVCEHRGCGKELVAHLVLPDGGGVPAELERRIRRAVAATLPATAVPERIRGVASIALTPDGKVDRGALAHPCPEHRPAPGPTTGHGAVRLAPAADEAPDPMPDRYGAGRAPRTHVGTGPALGDHPMTAALSLDQAEILDRFERAGPGPSDNVVFAVRIDGPVDRAALGAAVRDLADRHPVLRTGHRPGGGPQVHPAAEIGLQICGAVDAGRDDEAVIRAAAGRRIDIGRQAPLHAELMVRSPHRALLLIVVHHLGADRWSGPSLTADLITAYRARTAGAVPQWPPHPMPYSQVARRQRAVPPGPHLTHWARVLGTPHRSRTSGRPRIPPGRDTPVGDGPVGDGPVGVGPVGVGPVGVGPVEHVRLAPDPQLLRAIDQLAATARADERSVLLGLVAAVLHPVGAAVLWAPAPEAVPPGTEGTLGPLVPLLPVRVDVPALLADPVAAIGGLHDQVRQAAGHLARPVPGPPERVVVTFGQPDTVTVRTGPGTTMTPLPAIHPAATTGLSVGARPQAAGLLLDVEFRPDRYGAEFVAALGRRLSTLGRALQDKAQAAVPGTGRAGAPDTRGTTTEATVGRAEH